MEAGNGISMQDALCLISAFVVYGNSGITCINGLIVEEFLQDYQAGEALTTWVVSVQIALSHISGFLAGTLVELYGNRVVTMTGTLVAALGFISTAYADHVGQLFLTYSLLTGMGIGLQFVPALVVPQIVFTRRRSLAVAFILAGGSTGAFVFPVMFNYFREEYGYRGALLLWAGIMLNSLPLGLLMTMHPQLPRPPSHGHTENETKSKNDTTAECKDDIYHRNGSSAEHMDKPVLNSRESLYEGQKQSSTSSPIKQECYLDNQYEMAQVTDGNCGLSNGSVSTEDCKTKQLCECQEKLTAQLTLLITAMRDASNWLRLSRISICGEFRRALMEMKQGLLELHNGSCRVLIAVVFFYACGYMMPYIFLPGKALQMGFSKGQAAWLVATIGMAETCARICAGLVGFVFKKQIVIFYGLTMLLSGVGCIGMLFATSYEWFLVTCVLYGAGIGSYVSTYTQAAIAIVGILKIVRIIGLISLAWGIAYMISPSLGGCVYEATGNVDVPFYMGSPLQLLAALLICSYRLSPMYKKRHGALDTTTSREVPSTEEHLRVPSPDSLLASSHSSLASTHQLRKDWGRPGSYIGSTHSSMPDDERTCP